MTSEADVDGNDSRGWTFPAIIPLNFVAVRQMAAEVASLNKMASDMEVRMKQRCVIEFLREEKIAPNDIHRSLLNLFTETKQCMLAQWGGGWNVSALANGDLKDKPRSVRPCTACHTTKWKSVPISYCARIGRDYE